MPARFRNAEPVALPANATVPVAQSGAASTAPWWSGFGSTELDALMDRALANNSDLKIATLQLAQTQIRADQARAGQLPTLSLPALAAIQAPGGQVGSVPVGGSSNQSQRSYQASVQGNWRLDAWGEQKALAESADQQVWRAVFERENVQRNVLANLANAYLGYLSVNDRLAQARESEALAQQALASLQQRVALGDATIDDLEQHRAAVQILTAALPQMEQQREDSRNTIAFLVGASPLGLELSRSGLDSLKGLPIPARLPSALLLQRPDIRQVEARMRAADADIEVARARLLPPIDLSAQSGYSGLALAQLLQPQNLFWNAIASVSVSIFDGGRKKADKAYSQAYYEEMVETYRRTILQAIREVEGALLNVRLTEQRLQAQRGAVTAARRAWEASTQMFTAGALDQATLLDVQRSYNRYLEDAQRLSMELIQGQVALVQALGGGLDVQRAGTLATDRGPATTAGMFAADFTGAAGFAAVGAQMEVGAAPALQIRADGSWQVELPGLYHHSVLPSVWRDLRGRYPGQLDTRTLLAERQGAVTMDKSASESWYRVSLARFPSQRAAEQFCANLQAQEQTRCKVNPASWPRAELVSVVPQRSGGGW